MEAFVDDMGVQWFYVEKMSAVGKIVDSKGLKLYIDKLSNKYGIMMLRDQENRGKCFVFLKETYNRFEIDFPGPYEILEHGYGETADTAMSECLKDKIKAMGEYFGETSGIKYWCILTTYRVAEYGKEFKSFKKYREDYGYERESEEETEYDDESDHERLRRKKIKK